MISAYMSKWLFGILGIIHFGYGLVKIYEEGTSISGVSYIIIGLAFLLYSVLIFTNNPFAPKVIISDAEIKIKRKAFRRPLQILWSNIQSIEFDNYLIVFHLQDRIEKFSFNTNAETSIEIKSSIREIAENNNIQISGG